MQTLIDDPKMLWYTIPQITCNGNNNHPRIQRDLLKQVSCTLECALGALGEMCFRALGVHAHHWLSRQCPAALCSLGRAREGARQYHGAALPGGAGAIGGEGGI